MDLRKINTTRINPAPYNPRVDLKPGDTSYDKLKRSIDEFGCVEPLVWNQRTGNLVGGHQRFKVLTARGDTKVDVVVVDLPSEREKALNIALNKIAGDWDPRKLSELLDELVKAPEIEVELTGFDMPEIEDLLAGSLDEHGVEDEFDVDEALDAESPAVTQPGDLIELGRHRLLCGDCTDPKQVKRLMDGQRAALFATDPPYLVDYDGTNHPGGKKANKDWSGTYGKTWDDAKANPDLYERFIKAAIDEAIRPDAAWYCWHASKRQAMVEDAWVKHGAFVHQQIVWVKDQPILNRSWFGWRHEPCFFGWIKGNRPPRTTKQPQSTVWEIESALRGAKRPDHPTVKPVEIFAIPMRHHTHQGDVCYEPFAGSGTQIIAAERLRRRCFAVEISPHYCDVIVRRLIACVGLANTDGDLVDRYMAKKAVTA